MKLKQTLRRCSLLILLFLTLFVWAGGIQAKPFVHQLFSSNMVLQRDSSVPVWGWTTAGAQVNVTINGQTRSAVAASDGRWQVAVGPFGAGGPYTLLVSGPQSATYTNVMIGDVWLCMGQSNMSFTINGFAPTPLINKDAEIADSVNYPKVRVFTTNNNLALTSQDNVNGSGWRVPGTTTTGSMSATAYFTAREIFKQQNVPIGVVVSAWGGTEIKAWTSPGYASGQVDFKQQIFDAGGVGYQVGATTVSAIYNGMVAPLAPFKIKGVVWYQGESNTYGSAAPSGAEQYSRLLYAFRSNVRSIFGSSTLPFIVVQLAPTGPSNTNAADNDNAGYPALREAQAKAVQFDATSRLVTTTDLGDADGDLHPDNKQDVGRRVALAAANVAYGQNVVNQGPVCTGVSVSGSVVTCTFSNTGGGLMVGFKPVHSLTPVSQVAGGTLTGFALASAKGGPFVAANATITGPNTVAVSASGITSPSAVRYGWKNYPVCNLYNKITNGSGAVIDGMPASPFRNDSVVRLTVNSGTITPSDTSFNFTNHSYVYNSPATVSASTFTGLAFTGWSGDTSGLANASAASTTATLGQNFASVLANYRVTAAPANFVATSSNGPVQLTWNAINGAHYNLFRSTSSGGAFTTIASNLVNVLSYTDASIANGTTYYYKISATNLTNTGPQSATVSVVSNTGTPGQPLARTGWIYTASQTQNGSSTGNVADGSLSTRWTPGVGQGPGQWFRVDFGGPKLFNQVKLDAGTSTNDYPRGYQVHVSNDGVNWGSPVASGTGSSTVTPITFAQQTARYIRVTQTGSTSGFWSISELNVIY